MGRPLLIFTLIVIELLSIAICPAMEDKQDPCDFPIYERMSRYFNAINLNEEDLSKCVTYTTDMPPDNIAFNFNGVIPSSCLVPFEKATELFKKQKYAEAIGYLDETIRLCPDYADAWYNRGYNKFHVNLYNEALEDFSMAIVLNPKDAECWAFKGITLIKLKRVDEALTALNISLSIDASLPCAKKWKAHLLESLAVNISEQLKSAV